MRPPITSNDDVIAEALTMTPRHDPEHHDVPFPRPTYRRPCKACGGWNGSHTSAGCPEAGE